MIFGAKAQRRRGFYRLLKEFPLRLRVEESIKQYLLDCQPAQKAKETLIKFPLPPGEGQGEGSMPSEALEFLRPLIPAFSRREKENDLVRASLI